MALSAAGGPAPGAAVRVEVYRRSWEPAEMTGTDGVTRTTWQPRDKLTLSRQVTTGADGAASLALTLRESDCEHLVQLAGKRGLWGADGRWLPRHTATDGWALETQGQAQAPTPADAAPQAPRRAPRSALVLGGGVQPHLLGLAGHAAL